MAGIASNVPAGGEPAGARFASLEQLRLRGRDRQADLKAFRRLRERDALTAAREPPPGLLDAVTALSLATRLLPRPASPTPSPFPLRSAAPSSAARRGAGARGSSADPFLAARSGAGRRGYPFPTTAGIASNVPAGGDTAERSEGGVRERDASCGARAATRPVRRCDRPHAPDQRAFTRCVADATALPSQVHRPGPRRTGWGGGQGLLRRSDPRRTAGAGRRGYPFPTIGGHSV